MQVPETKLKSVSRGSLRDYIEVIKPRETGLLVFIGAVAALAAKGGAIPVSQMAWILAAILTASAGANGLTNYLDREIDSCMERTRRRALPTGRIYPAERVLFLTVGLIIAGLILAWYLHPFVFLVDTLGTSAAIIYRKRVTCVFPQGMVASSAPVLMGWLAVRSTLNWEVLVLCLMIAIWLPSHIWSIMLAHKKDYIYAGITYFPVNRNIKSVALIMFISSLLLYASSLGLYFVGHFGWLYLVTANILGIIIIYASFHLLQTNASQDAWKLYKLSAFPYLGIMFLVIGLDIVLRV